MTDVVTTSSVSERTATSDEAARTVGVYSMTPGTSLQFSEPMHFGTVDTRSLDLYPSLSPAQDAVASITSVVAARADGGRSLAGDLLITPSGHQAPWTTANAAGVLGMQINWWQSIGTKDQIGADAISYTITVTFVTTAGRTLVVDIVQLATSVAG